MTIAGARLDDTLLLAVRACATHSGGPLRAIADLHDARLTSAEYHALGNRVRARLGAQEMPADRRAVLGSFLTVVVEGLIIVAERDGR